MVLCDAPYAPTTTDPNPITPTLEGRLATWELMPNMRIGTFSHYRENNQRVYASLDGKCVCHHGECGGTIRAWLTHEKCGPITRLSTCDCTESQGLQRKVKGALPPRPSSYFELLCAADAEQLPLVSEPSRELRATPMRCESGPIFLSNDGRFFCNHGNQFAVKKLPTARTHAPKSTTPTTESPIKKQSTIRRRFRAMGCDCKMAMPNRASFPELPFAAVERGSETDVSD